MAIELTQRAAEELKRIIAQQGKDPASVYLRVGVKGGGCSGFTYWLDLVEQKGEFDEEFESHGIRVLCDPKSYLFLAGTVIDFREELMGRGFVFNNPNATRSCACGSSFAI